MYQDGASSLPLQISLYYHGFYSAALAVLSLLLFIYKSALLPYPPTILGAEVAYVFLYGIVEWIRIRQASRGNRLESIATLLFSLILAAPVIIFHVYFISLQTYVLRLDVVVQAIALAFTIAEVIFSVLALLAFSKAATV